MNRCLKWLAIAAFALTCMTACGSQTEKETTSLPEETDSRSAETSAKEEPDEEEGTETTNQPSLSIADRAGAVADITAHPVIDETGTLSEETLQQIEAIARTHSSQRMMNLAVVVTQDLAGESPGTFAKKYYQELFGKNSTGMLILINNASYEDVIHTSGVCSQMVTAEEKSLAIAKATPDLVEGSYGAALHTLLALCEEMPSHIFDRSEQLTQEQYDSLAALAKSASAEKRYCVLLTDSVAEEEEDAEEALNTYAEEQLAALDADILLVVDTASLCCTIVSEREWKQAEKICEEAEELLQGDTEYPAYDAAEYFYEALTEA